jgi:hypothetical protein
MMARLLSFTTAAPAAFASSGKIFSAAPEGIIVQYRILGYYCHLQTIQTINHASSASLAIKELFNPVAIYIFTVRLRHENKH